MKNYLRFPSIYLYLLVIIPGTVLGNEQEGQGQLLCDPSDPICQKFKQMLDQQEAETKYKLKPRQNGEEPILCDMTNPICQKFQQMLDDPARDEPEAIRTGDTTSDNENVLDCDLKDPICQKFQGMLQQQHQRNNPDTGIPIDSENQGQIQQGTNSKCIQWLCMLQGKTCHADGTCGDLVEEKN